MRAAIGIHVLHVSFHQRWSALSYHLMAARLVLGDNRAEGKAIGFLADCRRLRQRSCSCRQGGQLSIRRRGADSQLLTAYSSRPANNGRAISIQSRPRGRRLGANVDAENGHGDGAECVAVERLGFVQVNEVSRGDSE
jgi:hypothetical protein